MPRLTIRTLTLAPPLLCAPMAGITHSAFRRLVAGFGGCGALYTEMLSARSLPCENPQTSPFLRRRPGEPPTVYQLLLCAPEHAAPAVARLREIAPDALDLNLGCPAPEIRTMGGGAALWRDLPRLEHVLGALRETWDGVLLVKCRLGDPSDTWRAAFVERLELFDRHRVDCLVVHPRFSNEKLKRRARWEEFAWIRQQTSLPLIGNGDIDSPACLAKLRAAHPGVNAWMLGRIAAVRPWIFAECAGLSVAVDPAEVWARMVRCVDEDFAGPRRLGRIKEFTEFYSRNFAFGHDLFRAVQSATSPAQAAERASRFFKRPRELLKTPSIASL